MRSALDECCQALSAFDRCGIVLRDIGGESHCEVGEVRRVGVIVCWTPIQKNQYAEGS
jgi:hypothetical protein